MILAQAPPLLSLPLRSWQLAPALEAAAAVYMLLYAWAAARVRAWPAWRTACFLGGVCVVLVALQSGIGTYDDRLLSAHMVEHMLLLLPAPALLLLGRPLTLALRSVPAARRRRLALLLARLRTPMRPAPAIAAFSLIVLATHLRAFYDATLAHPLLHDAEHAAYLIAGLLLFAPLLDADPGAPRRLGGIGRLVYMLAATPAMALVGAYLSEATHVVYSPYRRATAALGGSALRDQHDAGAIMWVGGGLVLVAVGLASSLAAMVAEERRMAARERRADLASGALAGELRR
jgi:cytochrome c oxidase assembly factor CtaG